MKKKEFSALDIAKELLRQKPDMTVNKIADAIGLKMFNQLLLNESLQGIFCAFPRKSTIKKILMRAKIRNELQNLGSKGEKFKIKVKELAQLFGKDKCQIREEFDIAKGHSRKKK